MSARPRVNVPAATPPKKVRNYPKPALVLKTPRQLAELVGENTPVKVSQVYLQQIAAEQGAAAMKEQL